MDETRASAYRNAISARVRRRGPPPAQYICGDDEDFERIGSFAAAYNRVLVYRSVNLHSADIAPGFAFDPAPRTGRLTANTFFFYR